MLRHGVSGKTRHGFRRYEMRAAHTSAYQGGRGSATTPGRGVLFRSTPPGGGRPGPDARPRRRCCRFNPRPRVGGDAARPGPLFTAASFQSAPPGGGRRASLYSACSTGAGFNPRPRVGGDLTALHRLFHDKVFQSAPPGGGRLGHFVSRLIALLFQSAPPGGGRLLRAARQRL